MKFLVLDGNSIFSRAFYGIKMLSNKSGQMTNGIYGFISTLWRLLAEVNPDRVAIAFDISAPTFRHKMYEGYKATRHKTPDELISQLPILKELLFSMGYQMISLEGYEADDILGTFSYYCEENKYDCVLATGDRDILQLVSKNVCVRIASTKFGKPESTLYDLDEVKKEYGVMPENLVDIKALQGDTSDNIPGVKGIGKKTANDLIVKFGNIDQIYENIEIIDIKPSLKEKLIAGKDSAYLSYALGKIDKHVPIEINEQDYVVRKMDSFSVKKIMTDLEFFSFIKKLDIKDDSEKIILEKIDLKYFKSLISEKDCLNFMMCFGEFEIKKIFISVLEENKIYMYEFLEDSDRKAVLKDLMESSKIEKVTHNFKILEKYLERLDIEVKFKHFDVMLASYLINPSEKDYEISRLENIYEISKPSICSAENQSCTEEDISLAEKTYSVAKLKPILEEKIKQNNQNNLLEKIEQPLSKVLASMENIGFLVDKKGLENYSEKLKLKLAEIEKEIYDLSGEEFNINSPKQLGTVLFEKLKLPYGKKGKTGYSTGAAILEKLSDEYEVVKKILDYRALSKLKSTYCDGIVKLITPSGRVHSSFNQTETRTGRISSSEPNLQNIPVRTKRGKLLRKFFKAPEDFCLIDADYSQIELRVLAHVAQDENMIKAFKNKEDIHAITASEIMGVPLDMVTPEMRFRAKAINYGILYGMSAFSLAKDLEIGFDEAQIYISRYLNHYKGVSNYMSEVIDRAKIDGFVETIFFRRRYLPELSMSNRNLRAFGERVARNMPIQGAAADIIKIAMINVYEKLKQKKSKLILQVHDELIIESPKIEAEEVKIILKNEMENAVKLSVPLDVNISVGKTWFDAKE